MSACPIGALVGDPVRSISPGPLDEAASDAWRSTMPTVGAQGGCALDQPAQALGAPADAESASWDAAVDC